MGLIGGTVGRVGIRHLGFGIGTGFVYALTELAALAAFGPASPGIVADVYAALPRTILLDVLLGGGVGLAVAAASAVAEWGRALSPRPASAEALGASVTVTSFFACVSGPRVVATVSTVAALLGSAPGMSSGQGAGAGWSVLAAMAGFAAMGVVLFRGFRRHFEAENGHPALYLLWVACLISIVATAMVYTSVRYTLVAYPLESLVINALPLVLGVVVYRPVAALLERVGRSPRWLESGGAVAVAPVAACMAALWLFGFESPEVPDGSPDVVADSGVQLEVNDVTRSLLAWPTPPELEREFEVPADGAWLEVAVAVHPDAWNTPLGGPVRFRLWAEEGAEAGAERSLLFEQALNPVETPSDRRWVSERIDLSRFSGETRRLSFSTEAPESGRRYAVWARPILAGGSADSRPNIILVSIDTLRADHLNAYGYARRSTSPTIDALASRGALFENAGAHAPGTLSSQMSLLTGLHPTAHGVTYERWTKEGQLPVLSRSARTIAELLEEAGYITAAFTGGGYFLMPLGYSRGFDLFVTTNDYTEGGVANVGEKAFGWLKQIGDSRFFLFFHTYEVHVPYTNQRFVHSEGISPVDARAYNEALYDGGIALVDEYIGRLVRLLRELGRERDTLLILTSDHGEEFGDHYPIWTNGHGQSLYDEQIAVPLIFYQPGTVRGGARIREQVGQVDVAPTILAAAGVPADRYRGPGASLWDFLVGREDSVRERLHFSEDVYAGPERKSLRTSTEKYIFTPDPSVERRRGYLGATYRRIVATPPIQYFDLRTDPAERENLVDGRADRVKELHGALVETLESLERFGGDGEVLELDEEARRSLEALGYLSR